MNKYNHLRAKALELRQNGMRLCEIQERLQLSKTTIYYWIKDLEVEINSGRSEKEIKAQTKASQATKKKWALKRQGYYEEGLLEAEKKFADPLFRDFVILYLTEGYKRSRNTVSICNSDADIMILAHDFLKLEANNKLYYSVQCHIDNDENEIKQFWANKLGISADLIRVARKSNSNHLSKRQWRSVNGVCTVGSSDTKLRSKMQAWIEYLKEQWTKKN